MLVLLVHGLGRTPLSLFGLASALRRDGHHTRHFGYSPTLESVPRIVRRLTSTLHDLSRYKTPVGLVGHSLGGLFLRMALPEVPTLRVHHLVTLGTPASPPRMAQLVWNYFPPFRLFTRDCGRLLTSPAAFAALAPFTVPFTTIAGTSGPRGRLSPFGNEPNDGLVAVSEACVGTAEPELFPTLHTVMMDAVGVRARISAMMSSDRVGSHSLSGS
jgi:pimeloyl-ACP methyl ester carboxylesterase